MKRLLLVDDDPDHRLILRTMFEAKGYGCEEAEDGDEALSRLVEEDQLDLVLTDLDMPVMNGFELIERMKRQAFLKNTPVILMTSHSREDISSQAYKTGVQAVISKPYDFSKLLDEVARAIWLPKSCGCMTIA